MVEEVGTLQIHKRNVGCFLQPFELSHRWTRFDPEKAEDKYKIYRMSGHAKQYHVMSRVICYALQRLTSNSEMSHLVMPYHKT